MKIANHKLVHDDGTPYPFKASPNLGGPILSHDYLIIHYTEGQTVKGAVEWLTSHESKVSAHLVIGRDGSMFQLVPFDRTAVHTGRSQWQGRKGLARYSIGIELDNAGKMSRKGVKWVSGFGKAYPESDILEGVHKFGARKYGWHMYPQAQLEAAAEVAAVLVREYGIGEILGHDDIAPKRKWDPGPAFPTDQFRATVAGMLTAAQQG